MRQTIDEGGMAAACIRVGTRELEAYAMDGAADRVASVAAGDLMYGERLKVRLAALRDEFPGGEIWYVIPYAGGEKWCARPLCCGDHRETLYAVSPGDLAGAVSDVITGDAR
jgi:hypothetical protein